MGKTIEELKIYLEQNKKLNQSHIKGMPIDGYFCGYYQGKLDMIDWIERFLNNFGIKECD